MLVGLGAFMAGLGSAMSGWAALKVASKKGKEEGERETTK